MIDPNITKDLVEYLQDAKPIRKVATTKAILSPLLEESEVTASINKLSELRDIVEDEIKTLSNCMKFLSKKTRDQVKALRAEMQFTIKQYNQKIKKLKPKVMEKIKKIQKKRDREVTIISKKYDKKLGALQQEKVRSERTLVRLSTDIERIETGIKSCRDYKDEAGEFQLAQQLEKIKKKLPIFEKKIKDINKNIEHVEDAKKIEVARARAKPDDRIEEAMKVLRDLEAAKEARTRLEQQELVDLEKKTSSIIKQIDEMIKTKETVLNEFEGIGTLERRRKNTLVYLPVYFICYETEVEKRYVVFPPSYVSIMCIKTKLKSVFGAGKMKSFLQYRSTAISTLVDRLVDLTQGNPVFEKDIIKAGTKANILGTLEFQANIEKGLTQLRDEGWISESELETLSKILE
jgi:hypothetical protein